MAGRRGLTTDRPVYRQVAEHLRDAIRAGRYDGDRPLPSENALATRYGITRTTARQAIEVLKGEGLVYAVHGKGVFVRRRSRIKRYGTPRLSRDAQEQPRGDAPSDPADTGPATVTAVRVTRGTAPADIAERLGVQAGVDVCIREYEISAHGYPLQLATSYLPVAVVAGSAIEREDLGPGGLYARLADLGHEPKRFVESVTARMPTPEEAEALDLGPGMPVIRIIRIAYAAGDRPVEVCDMRMAADRYELLYDLPGP